MPSLIPFTLRHRFRQRPLGWLLAAGAAILTTVVVAGALDRADRAAATYGGPRPVMVATRDLVPGDEIDQRDAARRELPAALVPDGAVTDDAGGRTVTEPIFAGEPLNERRLAPTGVGGPVALVPPDARAFAIPVDPMPADLAVGDHVDLLSIGTWLARDAIVVGVDEGSLTVAVDELEAPAVSRALLDGAITPALVSP